MKAFQVQSPHQYRLLEVDEPVPAPGEVIVRTRACGICGSDVDVLEGKRPESVTRYPAILGHEFAGEVVKIGSGVSKARVGDRVAVDAIVSDGCENCRKGWVCHCRTAYAQLGFTRPGGMADFVAVPEGQLYKLADGMTFEEGALVEPASCAAHGVAKAETAPGDNVVIIGAGPIGVLAMQIAGLLGPQRLILVETDPIKLEHGEELGATHCVDARKGNVAQAVRGITGGKGADAIVECAGSVRAIGEAFAYASTKARISIVGVPDVPRFEVDYIAMLTNDLTLRVSNGYTTAVWMRTMELFASKQLRAGGVVTHRLPVSRAGEGFDLLRKRKEYAVKVMLTFEE